MQGDLGMALRCKISRMNESDVPWLYGSKRPEFLVIFSVEKIPDIHVVQQGSKLPRYPFSLEEQKLLFTFSDLEVVLLFWIKDHRDFILYVNVIRKFLLVVGKTRKVIFVGILLKSLWNNCIIGSWTGPPIWRARRDLSRLGSGHSNKQLRRLACATANPPGSLKFLWRPYLSLPWRVSPSYSLMVTS